MGYEQFYLLLYSHWSIYFFSLLLSLISLYGIIKRYTLSWFDPLRIALVFSAFANSIPIFLLFMCEISVHDFVYFIFSEFLFWLGFCSFSSLFRNIKCVSKIKNEEECAFLFFFVCSILFITEKLYIYGTVGIPLFLDSRLSVSIGSNGMGAFVRVEPFILNYSLCYCIYALFIKKKYGARLIWVKFVFLFIFVSLLLSGSKSAFYSLFYIFFFFKYYISHVCISVKKYWKGITCGICLLIFTLFIAGNSNPLLTILLRLIACGDIYWFSYPNENYTSIDIGGFNHLLQGILGPLRLVDYDSLGRAIGMQLVTQVYDVTTNTGPNSRIPIVTYILLKNYGVILSFLLGSLLSFMLYYIGGKIPKKSCVSLSLYCYIYQQSISFITDPISGFSALFDIFLNLVLFLPIFLLLLNYISCKKGNV